MLFRNSEIYIAPLHGNYTEALPTQSWRKQ